MAIPEKINRYEIKGELGRGGMATVYEAYDPRFQRPVAVKVLPKEFLHDPEFKARFTREARTIAALEHPAIVPVYDFGEHEDQPFLVMRLMNGGSLTDRLEQGPIPIEDAAEILKRVGSALDRAHSQGIIHRDLKPGNILFDHYGDAFLADFGIARIVASSSQLTASGSLVGTPSYMSPEQVYGDKELDGRADIYALGVILYQMLTGEIPYEADTPARMMMAHVMNPVPQLTDKRPDLAPCDQVITKAMAKEREERYATASDLTTDLNTISQTLKQPQLPPQPAEPEIDETVATGTAVAATEAVSETPAQPAPAATPPPTPPPTPEPAAGSTSAFNEPTYADEIATTSGGGSKIPVWLWLVVGVLALFCIGGVLGLGFLIVGSLDELDLGEENDPTTTAVAEANPTNTPMPTAEPTETESVFETLEPEDTPVPQATDTAVSSEAESALETRQSLEETREAEAEDDGDDDDDGPLNILATRQSLEETREAEEGFDSDLSLGEFDRLEPLFTPTEGILAHEPEDNTIEMYYPGITPDNFVMNVSFVNPYSTDEGPWDFGVAFRQIEPDDEFRLVVRSDGLWNLNQRAPDEDFIIQEGDVLDLLDLRPDEGNQLTMIVFDDFGYFFLNSELVDTLDLSARLDGGEIALGTGFYTADEQAGGETYYEDFAVWPLAIEYGPSSGELVHVLDDLIKLEETAVDLENALITATFLNPFAASENDWDIGFAFRDDDDATKYFLVLESEGFWELVSRFGDADTDTTVQEGEVDNLNLEAGGSNTMTLISWGDLGYFFLNGELVETLDLSDIRDTGDVEIMTAFYFDHEIEGEATGFEDLTILPLP